MTFGEPRPGETLGFDIDDGTGLRVARARFESESKFSWSMFDGYDRIRILTYSAGVGAIVRLLDRHGFSDFECVFGCESTLRTLKDIMAFQQVAIGDTRAAIGDTRARHQEAVRRAPCLHSRPGQGGAGAVSSAPQTDRSRQIVPA